MIDGPAGVAERFRGAEGGTAADTLAAAAGPWGIQGIATMATIRKRVARLGMGTIISPGLSGV